MALNSAETAAFERLLEKAEDTAGQSRFIRQFILAWWSAPKWGGFDLAMLSSLDQAIADDMLKVLSSLARQTPFKPEAYRGRIEGIVRMVQAETTEL